MTITEKDQYRYERKYRPKSWKQMIGQKDAIREIQNALSRPETKHFMFKGPSGVGKTCAGEIIARQLKYDYAEFNASNSRKIDDVRTIIIPALKASNRKVILMDEADKMTDPAQSALRRPLEKTKNTIMIFCVNHPHKIIKAIKETCGNESVVLMRDNPTAEHLAELILQTLEMENKKLKFNVKVYESPKSYAEVSSDENQ